MHVNRSVKQYIKNKTTSSFIMLRNGYVRHLHRERIKAKLKGLDTIPELTSNQKKQIYMFYQDNGLRLKNYLEHQYYYAKTGIFDPAFIPDSLFHTTIKTHFNNLHFAKAWKDKNYFNLLLRDVKMPETLIRNINGSFYDKDYNLVSRLEAKELLVHESEFVVKPTLETGGGKNVSKYTHASNIDQIFMRYQRDFIVQRVVKQHSILSAINDSSVNTIRITSLFLENKVHCFAPFLRVGSEGHFADNTGLDRILIGIDKAGRLNPYGYNLKEEKIYRHPNGNNFAGIEIPSFSKVISTIKSIHPLLAHFGLVFWDFILDKDANPVLIELNFLNPNITILQLIQGPIFGEMTNDILRSVSLSLAIDKDKT